MRKSGNNITLLLLLLFLVTMFIGCSSQNNSKGTFNIEQFQNEMKSKSYTFEMQDVEKDFLPTTRKRMKIDSEVLDIYVFSSNKKMENAAKCIDMDGSGYSNGSKAVKVDWGLPPHFYKKGSVIVQYVGGNEKMISHLKNILGAQFAGASMIKFKKTIGAQLIIIFTVHCGEITIADKKYI